jgi:hypothetical protein
MCKEMPVIPGNKVVDPKRIIGIKMVGRAGGAAQGVADPPPQKNKVHITEALFTIKLSCNNI